MFEFQCGYGFYSVYVIQPAEENMQPAQATTFRRGDFVVLDESGAANVGIVLQLRPSKVDVLWYERNRDGTAKTHGRTHDHGRLRMATSADEIPDAIWRLRKNL